MLKNWRVTDLEKLEFCDLTSNSNAINLVPVADAVEPGRVRINCFTRVATQGLLAVKSKVGRTSRNRKLVAIVRNQSYI